MEEQYLSEIFMPDMHMLWLYYYSMEWKKNITDNKLN